MQAITKYLIIYLFLLFSNGVVAQREEHSNLKEGSVELAQYLCQQAEDLYNKGDFDQSIRISKLAIDACEEVGLLQGVAQMLLNLGCIYRINGDFPQALKYLYSSLENFQTLGNMGGQSATLNQIGSIYRLQGNYPGALELFLNSLTLSIQVEDSLAQSSALNNIGIVYFYQNNYPKALEYYMASLSIEQAMKSEYGVSISYINIGEVHKKMGNYEQALDYFLKALVLAKKHEDLDSDGDGVGVLYNEIGSIYLALNDFDLSSTFLNRALTIFEEINNQQRLAECKLYLGELYQKLGKQDQALKFLMQALNHAKHVSATDLIAEANKFLSLVYESRGDERNAFKHFKQYIQARDSIFNEENMTRMVQTEMLYEFEKQLHESKIEQAKRDVKTQEVAQRQKAVRNLLIVILVIVLIGSGLTYNAYKNKKAANLLLAHQQEQILEKNEELLQQQEEIVAQRDEIESKNKILLQSQQIIESKNERIISSIEFAQTIQQAILPNREQLSKFFPEHVVLFMPKDIVSGDFYWFSAVNDVLIAAVVDCTGHGVPGSLMSVIGNTLLNQIVVEWQIVNPALILEQMHKQVRFALKQDTTDTKGHICMDVSIVSIDKKNGKVIFAGASRPLYFVNRKGINRIPGDPRSVGGFQREDKRYFTNHSFDLEEIKAMYLTTDGYIDQMDPEFKKFGQRRFSKLLYDIYSQPTDIQYQVLHSELVKHQNSQDQIDDICILGLKL